MAKNNNVVALCQEIESCRNLMRQLEDEAKSRSPFGSDYVELSKLKKYIDLLSNIRRLKVHEKYLMSKFPAPPSDAQGEREANKRSARKQKTEEEKAKQDPPKNNG